MIQDLFTVMYCQYLPLLWQRRKVASFYRSCCCLFAYVFEGSDISSSSITKCHYYTSLSLADITCWGICFSVMFLCFHSLVLLISIAFYIKTSTRNGQKIKAEVVSLFLPILEREIAPIKSTTKQRIVVGDKLCHLESMNFGLAMSYTACSKLSEIKKVSECD